jgi:transposase
MPPEPPSFLTPPAIGKLLGVTPETVIAWIRSGDLNGINVATNLAGRPRYKVAQESLDRFLTRRMTVPRVKPVRREKNYASVKSEFDGLATVRP